MEIAGSDGEFEASLLLGSIDLHGVGGTTIKSSYSLGTKSYTRYSNLPDGSPNGLIVRSPFSYLCLIDFSYFFCCLVYNLHHLSTGNLDKSKYPTRYGILPCKHRLVIPSYQKSLWVYLYILLAQSS